MNKNRLLQYVSVFDLVAISAWALFTLWHLGIASFLMPVMILLRLAISFPVVLFTFVPCTSCSLSFCISTKFR